MYILGTRGAEVDKIEALYFKNSQFRVEVG